MTFSFAVLGARSPEDDERSCHQGTQSTHVFLSMDTTNRYSAKGRGARAGGQFNQVAKIMMLSICRKHRCPASGTAPRSARDRSRM